MAVRRKTLMGEHSHQAGLCVLVIFTMILTTGGQAVIHQEKPSESLPAPLTKGQGSLWLWQDEFLNGSKIDQTFSHDIVVNTTVGTVSMRNTSSAWIDPSFTRMKPISIFNSAQTTYSDYDVNLTIAYDTDMQPDFDDIRFTNTTGAQLPYYLLNKTNSIKANVLVDVPSLPPGQTTIYLFYGNPTAVNQSSFASVFTWKDRTSPDIMISFKAATEGAWDPDVEYGGSRFLVTWEERLGPEDIDVPLPHWERTIPGVIHGRTYNLTGGDPIPTNNSDVDVSDPANNDTYHAENPSNAFGAGKFFVTWEQNPANNWLLRYQTDILGALVTPDGQVTMRFTICNADNGQFDPQVAYDNQSNRFLVVWADARNGADDYDIYGRLYNSNGFPASDEFPVAFETNYQGDPWVCSDKQGHFLVVYEDGPDPAVGPFSLYAYRVDSNGNIIGSRITIATGSDTVDYIYPAVTYNTKTRRYLVTWNDGDVSQDPSSRDSYDGNIWGKLLNTTGSVLKNNFVIEPGTTFIRTDVVPYFDTMFFVSYDGTILGNQDVYGRIINATGAIMTNRQELSDGSSQNVDWAALGAGAGRIFAAWEDERDLVSPYADIFGYVWRSKQTIGSPTITTTFGQEVSLVTTARLMSVPIQPDEFRSWREFRFKATVPGTTSLTFDIMDQTGTTVLIQDVQNGENVSAINASCIRLRGTFSRVSAQVTPTLDRWNVTAIVGLDIYPPSTTLSLTPAVPNGNNGWYVTPVTVTFNVTDPDSDPRNITTYYSINGYAAQIYDPLSPPVISTEAPNNYVDYWSNDSINEEIHHRYSDIKIDMSAPMITIHQPPDIVVPGTTTINGSTTEYTTGSGVAHVEILVNDETIFNTTYPGNQVAWFEWHFTAERGETYDLIVDVWDVAGNKMEERRTIRCPDRGLYEPGYIYWFDTPKIGPRPILRTLDMSIAVNYTTLYVVLPSAPENVASVKFVATQFFLGKTFEFWDKNTTDGCSTDFQVPFGIYSLTAFTYDSNGTQLTETQIITKLLIMLL
jgi:hypothetical protein